MPELPEVETIRRQIEPLVRGRTVVEAHAFDSPKFTDAPAIVGATLMAARRRGKYLLLPVDDGRELVVHLGMTGSLHLQEDSHGSPGAGLPNGSHGAGLPHGSHGTGLPHGSHGAGLHDGSHGAGLHGTHVRAWWALDDGRTLVFNDIRRFGRLRVVAAGRYDDIPTLHAMGPEPFDPELDGPRFAALLARSRRPVKTNLLSQRPIAGVGNIYADEALWEAGINPVATRLSPDRAGRLLDALRRVLRQGIDNGGTTLRDYRNLSGDKGGNQLQLKVYGRSGQPCPRCDRVLRRREIDARTTTWCFHCQRR